MSKCTIIGWLIFSISFFAGCTGHENRIEEKQLCLDLKLKVLKNDRLYKTVLKAFQDTFPVLKMDKKNFGLPSYIDTKIDDAIFFKNDSSQCLLIVLQKMKSSPYLFGTARVVRGMEQHGRWTFRMDLQYDFEKDYFNDYPQNSFENISKLARYGVLTCGNANQSGCEISDQYWFSKK